MRIPFIYRSDQTEDLSSAERNTRALAGLGLRLITGFMLVVVVLYVLVTAIIGGALNIPTSAQAVLQSVHASQYYSWSSESVRQVTLGQQAMTQDAFRSAAVDLKLNRWEASVVGVWAEPESYLSDGHLTADLSQNEQQAGDGWQLLTNVCGGAAAVPASAVEMPTAQDIEKAHPTIISDQGTVFGVQAWVIGFHPTPTIMSKLFWLAMFNDITTTDPQDRRWVLSTAELQALKAGDYTVDPKYTYAYVTRSDRMLRQIEVRIRFNIPGGSGWRFLVKMFPDTGEPLASMNTGKPECLPSQHTQSPSPSPSTPTTSTPGLNAAVPAAPTTHSSASVQPSAPGTVSATTPPTTTTSGPNHHG